MRPWRTLPPAAAPLTASDLWHGVRGLFSGQRAIRRVEEEMRAYFGARHLFFVSSGKAALTLILLGLKSRSPRRQVVLPAYTCFSVPSAVARAGLSISLCDLAPKTFDYDLRLLDNAINDETLCVVASHLFGIPADLDGINARCRARGIYVVEDAAQAMGGLSQGRRLGTIGDVGFFSFGRGKNITCGAGGVIVTHSDEIAKAILPCYNALPAMGRGADVTEMAKLALMALFIRPTLYGLPAALPWLRLGETVFDTDFPIQKLSGRGAGLLWNWKARLESSNAARARAGADYKKGLDQAPDVQPVAYLRFPWLCPNKAERDRFYTQAKPLGVSRMYPSALHEIPQIQGQFGGRDYPVACDVASRLVTLPTHAGVEAKDRKTICDTICDTLTSTMGACRPRL